MGRKIAFIGSGSVVFTRNLVRDILTFPAFADCEIALMDIDPARLELSRQAAEKIMTAGGYPATVTATTGRVRALEGADGVLTTIQVGGWEAVMKDVGIPKQFGVSINIGDTRGPSAVFRFLRTLPPMLSILRDMERVCPGATLLNYTNPMAMLCRALQDNTKVTVSGLCHSVQGTAEMLARWIGADMKDITYVCAGINHQAHYLSYRWKGRDAYPLIREAVRGNEAVWNEEPVRNEMFLQLGYYVTESSGHNSEYNGWFRKRPDLIERYCTHGTSWNPGQDLMERIAELKAKGEDFGARREQEFRDWLAGTVDLSRGHEYAAYIFNAIFGDGALFEFNGNVRNFGLIDNLPAGCCVEVPVLASPKGLQPIHVGPLPAQLQILNHLNASCEELAVAGALERDPEKIFHACLYDPLTTAVCSMSEIRDMVRLLFREQAQWLHDFPALN